MATQGLRPDTPNMPPKPASSRIGRFAIGAIVVVVLLAPFLFERLGAA